MRFRLGIRQALVLLCASVLLLYSILVFIICQCFMSDYYMAKMESQLIDAFEVLCENPDGDWELMSELEKQNLSLLVFRKSDGALLYNSKYSYEHLDPMVDYLHAFLLEQLEQTDSTYFIDTMDDAQRTIAGVEQYYGSTIYLGGDTGTFYVQISAHQEAIETSIDIATRFMLMVGLLVMVISTSIVLLLAHRMSKPLRQMIGVAEKIAAHDFTRRCASSAISEMQDLAASINSISNQIQDYTQELQAANLQLQADLDEKEKNETARKNLVSNISHDLKTPIALISGYADGLRSGMAKTDAQVREYCDVISDETDRMMDMICQMLEVSRLESGTVQLIMDDLDLSEELDGLLSAFRMEMERLGIILHKEYPENIYIHTDAVCVEQVLMNYMQNAVSHMGAGKELWVNVTGTKQIRITITNSAPVIPEEELERMWDTFYRSEKARSHSNRHSGLGLAIVRGNMELLGLPYGVQNTANGIAFWAEFPASRF